MIFAELFVGDIRLFAREIGGLQNFFAQPLVAARGREHAAHQVIAAVGVGKGVQGVVGVDAEFVGRDEDRAGRAQADVAAARANRAGADRRRGVVTCARHDLDRFRKAKCPCRLFCQRADDLEALKEPRHLRFGNAADVQHFLRPALVLYVEQQHAGGVGIITGMDAGELIGQIVLREHDLCDSPEVLRLVFAHPEELRCGKAREGDVRRQSRELVLADGIVEIVDLLEGTAVIPQNRRADDVIHLIQRNKTMHLAACADTCYLICIKAVQQLRNAGHDRIPPILGLLLRPARMREDQGILLRDSIQNRAVLRDKQQLAGGCPQVNTDIKHFGLLIFIPASAAQRRWSGQRGESLYCRFLR